jgi:hypothetical protein
MNYGFMKSESGLVFAWAIKISDFKLVCVLLRFSISIFSTSTIYIYIYDQLTADAGDQ